uniref:Uncharacterized protein n=1 Tax=Anguilla anguilla TaxID=7936 RepID=A0A0E9SVQ6_ANGAN
MLSFFGKGVKMKLGNPLLPNTPSEASTSETQEFHAWPVFRNLLHN